jgi:hypothetical protein
MPKSYTPNWFFTALLDNHINQMMARYSCLRALRMDFFYRKDTPDFLQPDHRWLVCCWSRWNNLKISLVSSG